MHKIKYYNIFVNSNRLGINYSMQNILLKIRSLSPYLLLIILYFIFISLEANRNQYNDDIKSIKNKTLNNLNTDKNKNIRISIPVIKYKE